MMTAEQLMNPRFEMIADYPKNGLMQVGDIIEKGYNDYGFDPHDFPHIFRKLKWWEYRKVEDMPKRVVSRINKDMISMDNDEIIDIIEWDMVNYQGWINEDTRECASLLIWNYEYGYFPID